MMTNSKLSKDDNHSSAQAALHQLELAWDDFECNLRRGQATLSDMAAMRAAVYAAVDAAKAQAQDADNLPLDKSGDVV